MAKLMSIKVVGSCKPIAKGSGPGPGGQEVGEGDKGIGASKTQKAASTEERAVEKVSERTFKTLPASSGNALVPKPTVLGNEIAMSRSIRE